MFDTTFYILQMIFSSNYKYYSIYSNILIYKQNIIAKKFDSNFSFTNIYNYFLKEALLLNNIYDYFFLKKNFDEKSRFVVLT